MNISLGDDLPVIKTKKDKKSSGNNPQSSGVNKEISTIDLSINNNQSLINRFQRESMTELMRSKTRDPIQILSSCTSFSRREVKMIYRNFKQVRRNNSWSLRKKKRVSGRDEERAEVEEEKEKKRVHQSGHTLTQSHFVTQTSQKISFNIVAVYCTLPSLTLTLGFIFIRFTVLLFYLLLKRERG